MSALTRWSPFRRTERELGRLFPLARFSHFRDMERAMEDIEQLLGPWPNGGKEALAVTEWRPLVDVTEDDKEYLVKAELPEVKKDEIKVTVQNGALTISGERKIEKEEKGRKYHRIERAYGSFERSFTVPEDADANKITSEFKDGLLTVHLPKAPAAKPKTIEVKTA